MALRSNVVVRLAPDLLLPGDHLILAASIL
jgi:hypothetical protein